MYEPDHDYNGTDMFTFITTDGNWISDPAAITIHIQSVNDVPTVENISIILPEDSIITINLIGDDIDGDFLLYSLITEPINGNATLSGSQLVYSPFSDYNGLDSMLP